VAIDTNHLTPRQRLTRDAALEARALGLSWPEVADSLGISRTSVWRLTRGCPIPEVSYPPKLKTERARTIWRLMQKTQKRDRKQIHLALERRIARAVLDVERERS
jgi:predicted DNA-binding transcriptional regulator AlpA